MNLRFHYALKRIFTLALALLLLVTLCAFDAPPENPELTQYGIRLTQTDEEPPDAKLPYEEPPYEEPPIEEPEPISELASPGDEASKYEGRLYVEGEVLVIFKPTQTKTAMARTLKKLDCKIEHQISHEIVRTEIPDDETLESFIEKLEAQPEVAFAQPNYIYQLAATVTDPYANPSNPNYQWHLGIINAFDAWDITMGSSDIRVAVLDTGIDLTHPEFIGQIYSHTCVVAGDGNAQDDDGHGTHVAGIIAAKADGVGSVGVAPNVQLIIVDVFGYHDERFGATSADLIAGIQYAVSNGARVINMSLGGYYTNTAEEQAVNNAVNAGVVCIAAAGNDNTTATHYPSDFNACISVIATDRNDNRASYSNYGTAKDISAPGGSGTGVNAILSSDIDGGYAYGSGTSMASPMVAGVAALMLSANNSLTVDQVKTILYGTAVDLGAPGKDIYFGHGRVNAYAAVLAASSPHTITASSSNTNHGTVSGGGSTFYGLKATVTATPRSGYQFAGWYEGETLISTQNTYTFNVTGNRTLCARWSGNALSVSFNSQGGSAVPAVTAAYGSVIYAPAAPTRAGYGFAGWYPTPACDTAPIYFPYTVTDNTTLYARWQPMTQYLVGVNLSAGTLSRAFSKTTSSYKILLGEHQSSVTITPVREYDGASMLINKRAANAITLNVANGKSAKATVKVTYGKKSRTYTFTVTRAKSTNNNLGALSSTAGTWSAPFDPNVTNYTLYLDENTPSVILRSTTENASAKTSLKSKKFSLKNGQTRVAKITVRAQSGARKTYVVNIVRAKSTNANLRTLKAGRYLSPAFNANVTDYTVTLPTNVSSVTLSAKQFDRLSRVTIDGARRSSKKIKLQNGQSDVVRVVVTSQAGTAKEYMITVRRE